MIPLPEVDSAPLCHLRLRMNGSLVAGVVPSAVRDGPASTQGRFSMRLNRVTSRIGAILVAGGLFVALASGTALAQGSPNGASTQRPVFYEGKQVTVNMFEVPASDPLLANNTGVNTIYASNDLDEEQDFLSVIDAIQGEGFNPCGTRSSSSLTRELLPTSSRLRTRSWRLRLGPILKSRSSRRTRSTAVRSLDRSKRMMETTRLQEAGCLHHCGTTRSCGVPAVCPGVSDQPVPERVRSAVQSRRSSP